MKRMILIVLLGLASFSHAAVDAFRFDNPEQERRYKVLISELRCLVCQNQNLAESNADLARDLRTQIHQMITSGSSDQDVIDYLVQRYGEFILYRPRLKPSTVLLWLGPFLLLAVGLTAMIVLIRRRGRTEGPTLDPEARARAEQLLASRASEDET